MEVRAILAVAWVLAGLGLPALSGRADSALQATTPAVSGAPSGKVVPVLPIRERERWFRDAWTARFNGGYSTDTDLGQIATGGIEVRSGNPGLIALDFGRPLVDNFRDWPIDFAWRIGLLRYLERGAQPDSFAHTAYLKMYWRPFPWERTVRTRIGLGEGLSYSWQVPMVERRYSAAHNEGTSRLLNYLDVSIDVNVGDLLRSEGTRSCLFGLVISHRSGVYGLVDIFGNVHSGSNYNTAALECDF